LGVMGLGFVRMLPHHFVYSIFISEIFCCCSPWT